MHEFSETEAAGLEAMPDYVDPYYLTEQDLGALEMRTPRMTALERILIPIALAGLGAISVLGAWALAQIVT